MLALHSFTWGKNQG